MTVFTAAARERDDIVPEHILRGGRDGDEEILPCIGLRCDRLPALCLSHCRHLDDDLIAFDERISVVIRIVPPAALLGACRRRRIAVLHGIVGDGDVHLTLMHGEQLRMGVFARCLQDIVLIGIVAFCKNSREGINPCRSELFRIGQSKGNSGLFTIIQDIIDRLNVFDLIGAVIGVFRLTPFNIHFQSTDDNDELHRSRRLIVVAACLERHLDQLIVMGFRSDGNGIVSVVIAIDLSFRNGYDGRERPVGRTLLRKAFQIRLDRIGPMHLSVIEIEIGIQRCSVHTRGVIGIPEQRQYIQRIICRVCRLADREIR